MVLFRPPAVAGLFYPDQPDRLRQDVDALLAKAHCSEHSPGQPPKALIVPHAGYVYSGEIAATAYACLKPYTEQIRRVVLLGPAHRVAFRGLAASRAARFRTPLGKVTIDLDLINELVDSGLVNWSDQAHAQEHSLEVQLPFLQRLIPSFSLVPLVVGDADAAQVAAVLERVWGGPETLILISSDLSHFEPQNTAVPHDQRTCDAILSLSEQTLDHHDACGRNPISGLLEMARRRHLSATLLDRRTSGDTQGDKSRVVGYAAFRFDGEETRQEQGEDTETQATLSAGQRDSLIQLAKASIRHGLQTGQALAVDVADYEAALQRPGAAFVTLEKHGNLRGCIGSLQAHRPLVQDVAENAYAAAFRDPRFPALREEELDNLDLHISVLTPAVPMTFTDEADLLRQIRPGVDGLILSDRGRRGTFLPSVWEQLPSREQFLAHLKQKAGLPADHWSDMLRVERYTTEIFGDEKTFMPN